MYTVESALEALRKYDISDADIRQWERDLNLDIPVDQNGNKQYSPHHINLFKNVRKHLALGRSLNEIKQIIQAPTGQATQQRQTARPQAAPRPEKNPYASAPQRPAPTPSPSEREQQRGGAEQVVNLMQRLTREKDQLYKKLMETEKLNSHLYSANNLYHRKVKDLTQQVAQMREALKENQNFKLLDDKAKLHRQLISLEKLSQYKDDEIRKLKEDAETLKKQIHTLENRLQSITGTFEASRFCGNWMETGSLTEVSYDNFGINIEPNRVRLFRIPETPSRVYGRTAIIQTSYQYETNALWRRNETLIVNWVDDETLEGELIAEYILDGVPVAKATYQVTCRRSQ